MEFARIVNETRGAGGREATEDAAARMESDDFVWVTRRSRSTGKSAEISPRSWTGSAAPFVSAPRSGGRCTRCPPRESYRPYVLMALPFGISGLMFG